MQTLAIERRPPLSNRDKVLISGSILIAWICLMGTIVPGFGMLGVRMSLWLYLTLCGGILLFTLGMFSGDLHPRSKKLFKGWRSQNPELFSRLMEVVAQAKKDPDGVGFFTCALALIEKDPDRATLLEGLYYWTRNKAQLQAALCRTWRDGLSPELTWALGARVRVAVFTDLQSLFRSIYLTATAGYFGGIFLYFYWSRVKALFVSITSTPQGLSWLWTLGAPATLFGFITIYLTWSKNRADREK
jgi:hypothetical protein